MEITSREGISYSVSIGYSGLSDIWRVTLSQEVGFLFSLFNLPVEVNEMELVDPDPVTGHTLYYQIEWDK